MLLGGYWVLGAGCWVLGGRTISLEFGHCILDIYNTMF